MQGSALANVPAGPHAFFRSSGQFGPQQFILYWPEGPVAFRCGFFFFSSCTWSLAHSAANHRASCTEHARAHVNTFSGHIIFIADPVPPCDGLTYGICPQSYLTARTGIKICLTNNIRHVTKLLMPKLIN